VNIMPMVVVFVVILMIATLSDIRNHRIPNWLTYPAIAGGIGYHTYMNGMQGFLFSTGGLVLGFLLLIFFYLAGGMGAGDVKLMGAVGAFLGAKGVFAAFLCTAVGGGVYALIVMSLHGSFKDCMLRYGLMLKTFLMTYKLIYIPPEGNKAMPTLYYGGAIALGASMVALGILQR
jgi:prepilin peptidase CpaA